MLCIKTFPKPTLGSEYASDTLCIITIVFDKTIVIKGCLKFRKVFSHKVRLGCSFVTHLLPLQCVLFWNHMLSFLMFLRGHSLSTYAKFPEKKPTNISNPLIRTRTCAYQGDKNVSFSENFAYVLNGWFLIYGSLR